MGADPGQALWEFSRAVYGRAAVEPACLALQERHDLDVNLLLFCGWAGAGGRTLSASEIADLIETVRPWRAQAIAPLRALRRWLKTQSVAPREPGERLRARVKADELAAEETEQHLLAARLPITPGGGSARLAAANMMAYLAVLGVAREADDTADLAAVLCGCFPDLAPLEAVQLLSG